jgi:hypothetical protein
MTSICSKCAEIAPQHSHNPRMCHLRKSAHRRPWPPRRASRLPPAPKPARRQRKRRRFPPRQPARHRRLARDLMQLLRSCGKRLPPRPRRPRRPLQLPMRAAATRRSPITEGTNGDRENRSPKNPMKSTRECGRHLEHAGVSGSDFIDIGRRVLRGIPVQNNAVIAPLIDFRRRRRHKLIGAVQLRPLAIPTRRNQR